MDIKKENSKYTKYLSLLILVIQNASLILCIRYTRLQKIQYLTSVVILLTEILKFFASNFILYGTIGKMLNLK